MNATMARLSLRLHAFELVSLAMLVGSASALAILVARWMDGSGYGPACVLASRSGATSAVCDAAAQAFYAMRSSMPVLIAQVVLIAAPFLLAAMAGVAVVGRELERGTTRLAWSLAPSRMRWFVGRVVPVAAAVIAMSFVAGVAADRLTAAMEPGTDVANGFVMFGFRGVVLAARVTFTFAVAVLVGAAMGRVLPALLVASVVVGIGLAGGSMVHQRILESEAVVVTGQEYWSENLYYRSGFLLPDGRFADWQEIEAIDPPPADGSEWFPKYPPAQMVVPGSRYRFVEARETLVLVGGSLVALALAAFVVRRARTG